MKLAASILILALAPAVVAAAQNQTSGSAQAPTDNEPVMFTLTIDEELIKALRDGQSLISTIPPSIRGKVDRIRIEFKPSATNSTPANNSTSGNSILNRNSGTSAPIRSGSNSFGQPNGSATGQPPPLRAPDLNTGFDRSGGTSKTGSSQPSTSDIDWNRGVSLGQRSTSLTPIDEPKSGWLMGSRRDSNAIASGGGNAVNAGSGLNGGGIQASTSPMSNYPLNRTTFDDLPSADGLYTGPPAGSRSLPPLESAVSSSGIAASAPLANQAADKSPSFDGSQVVSKPPAEASGKQPLASGDPTSTRQADRTQVYMFMLLLCSLGLNVYLAWISRGFYVRYHDLAAELRETFTPSSTA